jgi:hypothetical protein
MEKLEFHKMGFYHNFVFVHNDACDKRQFGIVQLEFRYGRRLFILPKHKKYNDSYHILLS